MLSDKTYVKTLGFTLVELIVGVAVFAVVSMSLYEGYAVAMRGVRVARLKALATALANEQFEIVRNMSYGEVGLVGGVPAGTIPRFQTLVRDGISFNATTTIRNQDDPFDGQAIETIPVDTTPADYKLVAIEIGCADCLPKFQPLEFTTTIVPGALETATNNGSLFIKVFDANGSPIPGAVVSIVNSTTNPAINIVDSTNMIGMYQLIDTPTSSLNYQITVTKPGYSVDRTYAVDAFGVSVPINTNKTVAMQQVTQASFSIDKTSMLNVNTLTSKCAAAPSVQYLVEGTKLLASSPNVLKTSLSRTTNESGIDQIGDLEWDTYNININDSTQFVSGTIPLLPLIVSPNSSTTMTFLLTIKKPSALLVTVKDINSLLPVSDATVQLTKGGFDGVLTTGQGYWMQEDWSGGPGQDVWVDESRYASSDGNIDITTSGLLKLKQLFGSYVPDGSLVSSVFDTGTSSSFYNLIWQGSNSIKFQIASNNDNETWNFVGPDGTAATFYSSPNQSLSFFNGNRYIRYKVFLHTDDLSVSPTLSQVSLTYNSECAPPGQVYFDDLSSGTYTIRVTKPGYQDNVAEINIPVNGYTSTSIMMSQ